MDVSKIISVSIDKALEYSVKEDFENKFQLNDDNLKDFVHQNKLLMIYSNILLETYHKELKKVLAKQGIDI